MARAKSPSPSPSPKISPRKFNHSIVPPPPNPAVVVNGAQAKNISARPPLRNNFDLEPNPFEQSFASSSSDPRSSLSSIRDNSNNDDPRSHHRPFNSPNESNVRRKSPSASSTASHHSRKLSSESVTSNGNVHQQSNGDTPKPILPPLASITSPSEQSYPWSFSAGLANSLRSGPLSPAMLTGPQQHQQSSATSVSAPLFGFDPSGTFRTGLTPSTGLTPLVGGPVAFPPPSPNTAAAFYALVNGSAGAGVGPNGSTITPNTLTALAGVFQGSTQPSLPSSTGAVTSASNHSQGSTAGANAGSANGTSAANQTQSFEGANPQSSRFASSFAQPSATQTQGKSTSSQENANDTNAAANGLFLLSQAHQELAKREEAQKQNQTQQQQSQAEANGKRGAKRKSDAATTAPSSTAGSVTSAKSAQPSKRTRTVSVSQGVSASTRGAAARRGSAAASISTSAGDADFDEMDDEDEEDNDFGDMGGAGSTKGKSQGNSKKPETEEEKRRNFLERNRQAALKCRQRKKAWLSQLQAKVEFLTNENDQLKSALVSSREEIARLTAIVGGAGVGMAGVPVNGAGIPVVGMVGVPMHHRMHAPAHHSYSTHHTNHISHGHHGPPVSVNVSLPPGSNASTSPTHGHHNGNGVRSGSGSPHSPSSDGRSSSVASVSVHGHGHGHGMSHSMAHHSRSHSGNTHGLGAVGPQPVAATGGMNGRSYGY